MDDMSHRLREITMQTKRNIVETKLLPYFGEMSVSEVSPMTVRMWQNDLVRQGYAPLYIRTINAQLSTIFNYAVSFFELRENPCKKAGSIGKSIGKKHGQTMNIWTPEEFARFVEAFRDSPAYYCGYHILFWTGMRIGELLALTWEDIDLDARIIRIDKTYQRINRRDVITPPKTQKSNRRVSIDPELAEVIRWYRNTLEGKNKRSAPFSVEQQPHASERIISLTKHPFERHIRQEAERIGLRPLRLHDLRHSHVSFLINNGISPLAIAKRVGHDKVETTLSVYSHLYPVKEEEIIDIIRSVKCRK